jgi:hypothetical protein
MGENKVYFENTRNFLSRHKGNRNRGTTYYVDLLRFLVFDILSVVRLFYGLHLLMIYLAYDFIIKAVKIHNMNRPLAFSREGKKHSNTLISIALSLLYTLDWLGGNFLNRFLRMFLSSVPTTALSCLYLTHRD